MSMRLYWISNSRDRFISQYEDQNEKLKDAEEKFKDIEELLKEDIVYTVSFLSCSLGCVGCNR